ncbi:MAG: hypothetical protein ABF289_16580 [Clostridiales bacterium]
MENKYKDSTIYLMDIIGRTNKNISEKVQTIMKNNSNTKINSSINFNNQKYSKTESSIPDEFSKFKNYNQKSTQLFNKSDLNKFQNNKENSFNNDDNNNNNNSFNSDNNRNVEKINQYSDKFLNALKENKFLNDSLKKINKEKITDFIKKSEKQIKNYYNSIKSDFTNYNNSKSSINSGSNIKDQTKDIFKYIFSKKMILVYMLTGILFAIVTFIIVSR